MKHDRSHRRDVRRHADPSVICLPGPKLPYTPPRKEPEVTGTTTSVMPIPDDEQLDAELLAHKNIFETQPRMSRQARRKAARAEKKAARHAATERFVAGASSLTIAASQLSSEMPEHTGAGIPAVMRLAEMAERVEASMLSAEAPALAEPDMDEALEEAPEDEALPLETVAQIISATGPLIVECLEAEEAPLPELAPLPRNRALVPTRRHWMLRLMPWRSSRRHLPAEPALVQLQDLRAELTFALRRLDQIIDTLPEAATVRQ